MTLHAMGEAVEALENTIRSIALNPKMEHAYVMKGSLEDDLGFPTRALRTYDRLLEINPDSYMAWLNKGITLIKQRRHAEAEAAFHRARAASSPPLSTAWPQTATMRRNGTRRSHAAKRRAERQRSPASAARRRRTSTTASRPARQR
jgi:tetratricopeptide (TPR) repeat protein